MPRESPGEAFVLELAQRPKTLRADFGWLSSGLRNRWVVLPNPDGFCDATLRCHRRLKISCRHSLGSDILC